MCALAAADRNHDLTAAEVSEALAEWEVFWASMRPVEFTANVERDAGVLAARYRLDGADAVHLGSARAMGSAVVTIAVWNKRLHAGAVAAGHAVAPATRD